MLWIFFIECGPRARVGDDSKPVVDEEESGSEEDDVEDEDDEEIDEGMP